MNRVENFEALKALQVQESEKLNVREGLAPTQANLARHHVLICAGTGCTSSLSGEVKKELEAKFLY